MVSLNFSIGSDGWQRFRLRVDGQEIDVGPFGADTDALGDLVRAGLHLATGGHAATIRFDGEPENWLLDLSRDLDAIERPRPLLGRVFYSEAAKATAVAGILVARFRCDQDELARAIAATGRAVLETWGQAGYVDASAGLDGFPLRGVVAIEAALQQPDPPGREP